METPLTLRPFQKKGVRAIAHFGGSCLLADEMGLGKTLQALSYLAEHRETATPALIVCPASLKYVWAREAARVGLRSEILSGTRPAGATLVDDRPPLTVINYDVLSAWEPILAAVGYRALVLDECHYIKSRGAKRTKAARRIGAKIGGRILALSGTPLTNKPTELFTVLNLLRPQLFPAFFAFAMRYTKPRKMPWGWSFNGTRNLAELHQILSRSVMIRRRKEDVLEELPEKTRELIPLEIETPEKYASANGDVIAYLIAAGKAGAASKAKKAETLVKLGILKRLAAELKLKATLDWIQNFLEESDGKLVVFAIHKKVIAAIKEALGPLCVVVTGESTAKERDHAVTQFQKGKERVFLGNIQAAGVGLTLTAARDLAFVELDWTPGAMTQAEDRIHRIGQRNAVTIHYLVGVGTIEERIGKILNEKQSAIESTLDGKTAETFDILSEIKKELVNENRKARDKNHSPKKPSRRS